MLTPCDIIVALNKRSKSKKKSKKLRYPRKTIKKFFFIEENQSNNMRNSAKNYIAEFADIKYHKKYITFSPK